MNFRLDTIKQQKCNFTNNYSAGFNLIPRKKKPIIYDKVVGLKRTKADRYGFKPRFNKKISLEEEKEEFMLDIVRFSNLSLVPINQTKCELQDVCIQRPPKEVENFM